MKTVDTFSPFSVEDNAGRRYRLVQVIGKGGQGTVFIEENRQYLVKIIKKTGTVSVDQLRNQFRRIRQLNLSGIPITRPLEILRPPMVGYVMSFLQGMQPIENLLKPPRDVSNLRDWYISTGGIRRRLKLLEKLARALHKLHSKGLVYCDISPRNIFVSTDLQESEVYLIDVDNLIIESNIDGLYTKWYGAPEIIMQKHGNDSLTDAFSFAVLAYKTLALDHPLIGDRVREGDPEMEQRALSGEVPWIHHSSDESNRSQTGFSVIHNEIISSKLFQLFQRTFELGLRDRQQRPGLGEWSRGLQRAYHFTVGCKVCGGSFYAAKSTCPWCGNPRPAYVLAAVDVVLCDSEQTEVTKIKQNESGFCMESPGKVFLTRKMLGYPDEEDQPMVEIAVQDNLILIRSIDGNQYWMTAPEWKPLDGTRGGKIKPVGSQFTKYRLDWQFHFGELSKEHRRLRFSFKPEGPYASP
jgi:eukaryotic-like serine/threonine-protein kinase